MRLPYALATALAATLGLAAAAAAGSLVSNPTLVATNDNIACFLANDGAKSVRDVVVTVMRYDPLPPATVAGTNTIAELMPLQYASSGAANDGSTAVYLCRFVFKGSGKALRGSAVVRALGTDIIDSQPAR